MRKIFIGTLAAAPLVGFAVYAFASDGAAPSGGNIDARPAVLSPAPSIAGKIGIHKQLSIKGVVIDDEDGLETDSEAEGDD